MNLWFFDSGNRGCNGEAMDMFGCIERDVVEWYKRRSDELEVEQGGRVPAMAFFHIPPQEFMDGWNVETEPSEVRRRITTRRDIKCRWRAARESTRESWMRFWRSRRGGEELWKRECGGPVRGTWPSERFLGGLSRIVYGVREKIGVWRLWNPRSYSKRSACAENSRESLFVRYLYRWRELEAWMAGGYALDERHAVLLQCWILCLLQKAKEEEERRWRRYQESLRSVAFWMSHSPSFSFITLSTWAINSRTRSLSCFVMSRRLASWLRDSTSTESPRCSNLNKCFLISFCKEG